jgi:hypothetical protein
LLLASFVGLDPDSTYFIMSVWLVKIPAEQKTAGVYWEIVYFDLNKIDTQKQDPRVNNKKKHQWVNNNKRTNESTKKNRTLGSKQKPKGCY